MNTLSFYPKNFREKFLLNMKTSGIKTNPEKFNRIMLYSSLIISLLSIFVLKYFNKNILISLIVFITVIIFFYYFVSLKSSARIRKMEDIFPDLISLMASNLRAGMTIDRAFLLSARPEFNPLDAEILRTGKYIATGRDVESAFLIMGKNIGSEKISKTINLIISGLKAGGNISDLLEQTSSNMKEKSFIEKKAASTISMYVIFIFFAIGVGAPLLYGLSTVLISTISNISNQVPQVDNQSLNLPLSFGEIPISLEFLTFFSIFFMLLTDLISCLVIGLVNKGDQKEGLKYFIPIFIVSMIIFFSIRFILVGFFENLLV